MKLFSSHHNIAVVGLNNSGKTTFVTSFINHILNHDPSKLKLGKGDVHLAFDEELLPPYTGLERFPYISLKKQQQHINTDAVFIEVIGKRPKDI